MQDTIHSLTIDEDIIELIESSTEKSEERELKEGTEFMAECLNYQLQSIFFTLNKCIQNHNILNYSAPIKSVITPPPNFI